MHPISARTLAYVMAVGFAMALMASLPFNGVSPQFLAIATALILAMIAVMLWRGYGAGLVLPRSGLAIALTLFWIWIGLTYFWSQVPYSTLINFWWVGSFVLVFWFYQLLPDRAGFWRLAALCTLTIALGLAALALYQLVGVKLEPRATFLNRNSLAIFLGSVALVVSAYFLATPVRGMAITRRLGLLGGMLFGLFFAFFLLRGRGASLSVLAGLMILLSVAWRRVEIRRIVIQFALLASSFILANMLWEGGVIDRFASTFNPTVVGEDGRLVIWREAWRMALDAPWLGIGLGTYWLAWPPYRHPQDGSGGFYVHNDYLQLWIETGVPGLVLLAAVYVSVLILFVRLLRSRHATASVKIEAAGLFVGLFAIAAHSFVDFNLYTLPILLIAGLGLGRFQELCGAERKNSIFVIQPSRWLRKKIYHALILVLAAVPLTYFLTLGASVYFADEAKALWQRGELRDADTAFQRAELLMPSVDVAFLAHAEMLHRAIHALPVAEVEHRRVLYVQAMELLNEAEQSNNLRPQIYFLRGELYQVAPEQVAPERVEQAYRTALRRDPRFHPARVAAAQLFLKQGDRKAARQLLEEGMRHGYHPDAQVLPFYELTLRLLREEGDDTVVRELADRIEAIHRRPASTGAQPAEGAVSPIPPARSIQNRNL